MVLEVSRDGIKMGPQSDGDHDARTSMSYCNLFQMSHP